MRETQSSAAALPHSEELVWVVWASASWVRCSKQEEAPWSTQDTLERLQSLAGPGSLDVPPDKLEEEAKEGGLGFSAQAAAPATPPWTDSWISRGLLLGCNMLLWLSQKHFSIKDTVCLCSCFLFLRL